MKLRNVLTVLATAAVTAAVTLLLFGPQIDVAQAGPSITPMIAQPQLTSQGCNFTLSTDKASYEAGQAPKIEVKAVNPTSQPVDATVSVIVTSTSPVSRMSRMMPIPTVVWSHEFAFHLASDETKTLSAVCAPLPALGGSVVITLTDQKAAVVAGAYGVPAPTQGQNQADLQAVQNAVQAATANAASATNVVRNGK